MAFPLVAADIANRAATILQQRCSSCHGAQTATSGLNLTSRAAILKGGARGPAIVPGKAKESRLWLAVTYAVTPAMPPGTRLPDEDIETLREWIDSGALWPEGPAISATPSWWAFKKPSPQTVPVVKGAGNPIDAFIRARLEKEGIRPAPEADRRTLLRRATFDLHGLPPTAEMMQAFLADQRPDAWERLIDRLLESPRYGEKWGRHWLDLARYGDTAGFEQDPHLLDAWRYRDWVIRSFNADKPYDRFVKEQIAGDELWPDSIDARSGTGFYRVGTNRDMLFKVEDINRIENLTDYVEATSSVFLGLTVGCARCHDHKFDPIPQRDFYRLQAIFAPMVHDRVFLDYIPARQYDLQENTRIFKLRQLGETIEQLYRPYRDRILERKVGPIPDDLKPIYRIAFEDRTVEQKMLLSAYEGKVTEDEIRAEMSHQDAERLHQVEKQLVSMYINFGPPPMAPAVKDSGREAEKTFIAIRGNWQAPGEEVSPGFLNVLGGGEPAEPPLHATTTYRRKALAEWIANPENPLFARVMVNRVWQFHFGSGLVRTPSDFGVRAGQPSNPELLDWLAQDFADRKWSLKAMHRLIMSSQTYRQSSNASIEALQRDPDNALLSHIQRRRVTSEELRDSVLQAAGTLNLKMGGIPVVPPLNPEELYGITGSPSSSWYVTADPREHTRRSVYLLVRRNFRQPMFEAFDQPDGMLSCARRETSTTATQSLTLLNGRFMTEQSRALAAKAQGVDDIWLSVYTRAPSAEERTEAEAFLTRQTGRNLSRPDSLAELARAVLNSNEFLYID